MPLGRPHRIPSGLRRSRAKMLRLAARCQQPPGAQADVGGYGRLTLHGAGACRGACRVDGGRRGARSLHVTTRSRSGRTRSGAWQRTDSSPCSRSCSRSRGSVAGLCRRLSGACWRRRRQTWTRPRAWKRCGAGWRSKEVVFARLAERARPTGTRSSCTAGREGGADGGEVCWYHPCTGGCEADRGVRTRGNIRWAFREWVDS